MITEQEIKAKQDEVFFILQDVRLGGLSEREAIKELSSLGVMLVDKDSGVVVEKWSGIPYTSVNDLAQYRKTYPLQEALDG